MTAYHDEHENELLAKPMTDKHEGLLPCPFCGGKPTLIGNGPHVVKCMTCGASSEHMYDLNGERAIAAWNRRASAPVPAEPVAWRYRWLFDGKFNGWEYLAHQPSLQPHLRDLFGLEEQPLYLHPAPNRDELIAALEAAQDVLAEYIVPDSGISDRDCINKLLSILDNQHLVRAQRALRESMEKQG